MAFVQKRSTAIDLIQRDDFFRTVRFTQTHATALSQPATIAYLSGMSNIALYIMAGLYMLAGIMHFATPKAFLSIMPKWVPMPQITNLLVGVAEFALGLGLLFEDTRSLAAWGLVALLVAVFPANWYHHQKARRRGKMVMVTLLRLPLQVVLIWWAWLYT